MDSTAGVPKQSVPATPVSGVDRGGGQPAKPNVPGVNGQQARGGEGPTGGLGGGGGGAQMA